MRVCPKCGYCDPPHWKNVKYSYYIEAITAENFKLLHPKMSELIEKEVVVDDEYYCYRLTKNKRWVERKAKVDFLELGNWTDGCEKHQAKIDWKQLGHKDWHFFHRDWDKIHPEQTKIDEVTS